MIENGKLVFFTLGVSCVFFLIIWCFLFTSFYCTALMQCADEALRGYKCIYMSLFEMVYLDGV